MKRLALVGVRSRDRITRILCGKPMARPALPPALRLRMMPIPSQGIRLGMVLLVTIVMGPAHLDAQPVSVLRLDPEKRLTQFVYESWGETDGLPQASVEAIAQTPDGYLWVGTQEGVARFDGIGFKTFGPSNTEAFREGASIQVLLVDAEGVLWIGASGGLVRYADRTFTRFGKHEGLTGKQINTLVTDSRGRLWVGTADAGLYVLEGTRFKRFEAGSFPADALITSLLVDATEALWIGTDEGLFHVRDDSVRRYAQADGLHDDLIRMLYQDRAGRIWIGTNKGVVLFENGRLTTKGLDPAPADLAAFAVVEDAYGHYWIGTDGKGLMRLRPDRIETFTTAEGLRHNRIGDLFVDREGSLWIGAEGGGLSRLRESKFTIITSREGLASDMVLTVYEDRQGNLWAGTEGGGLTRITGKESETFSAAQGLPSDLVLSIGESPSGELWAGTYGGGLARLNNGRFSRVDPPKGLASDNIFALHRGPSGALWIGTDAGVVRVTKDGSRAYTEANGLASNLISAVLEDRQGNVWIGTVQHGLNRIRKNRIAHYGSEDGFSSDIITTLFEDSRGVLWVGTHGGGLNRIKNGRVTSIRTGQGFGSDLVYGILEDGSGRLWFSSNHGVFSVESRRLENVLDGKEASVTCRYYGREDGLRSREMNGGVQPAAWKGRDGTLWFPTVQGLAGINPEKLVYNELRPPVVLDSVTVDGKAAPLGTPLVLKPGTKKLDVAYAALSFIAPEKTIYQYRLDGYDDDWNDVGSRRMATYTNLSPGEYTFRVRARNSEGVWSDETILLTFRQKPFFYQTSWFWLLLAVAMLGLGWGAYRLRIRRLEARQKELEGMVDERTRDLREANVRIQTQAQKLEELDRFKTRFFANISHEFRTPLTLMVGPLENALTGAYGPLGEGMSTQLQIMLRNALRLLRLINQLLDLSKLESGKMELRARSRNLISLLEGITFSFTAFTAQKGIDLVFETTDSDIRLCYEPDKLEKVFFNLLSNAVKFTPEGGAINVSVSETDEHVTVVVRDTGLGIPADQLPFIFDRFRQVDGSNTRKYEGTGIGLALVKELVLLHGGEIEATSRYGEGTAFTVTLRKGTQHLQPDQISHEQGDEGETDPHQSGLMEMASAEFNRLAETDRPSGTTALSTAPDTAPLILVVDDNPDIREYITSCLGATYRVATAEDGVVGLAKISELLPDLVVSDIMMPNMSGHQLCERVKTNPDLRHIPIMLLSAKTSQETVIESLEYGADEYMAKPFNARELHARIKNLLQMREQERALKILNEHLEEKVAEQLDIMLSDRKAYEAELVIEKERAEEAARLKSAILSNMSHEFRTPLTAILGYSEILKEELDGPFQEFADYIFKNSHRLNHTLTAVIDLARLEASVVQTNDVRLDVSERLRHIVRSVSPFASEKGLQLNLYLDEALRPVYLDAEGLEKIIWILLDNAVKFTGSGSVSVKADAFEQGVRIAVSDTGVGIQPSFLPHLFDAFEQESTGDNRTHEGVGLNLSIANRLVGLMGGAITVESLPGAGSTFTVAFPSCGFPRTSGDGTGEEADGVSLPTVGHSSV